MKKFIMLCSMTALSTIAFITDGYSQFGWIKDGFKKAGSGLKTVGKKVGSTVKTAGKSTVKYTIAPYKSLYNTGKVITGHGSVKSIYQPYIDVSKTIGNGVPTAVSLLNTPNRMIHDQAGGIANKLGGPGKFIFDVSTLGSQLSTQSGISAVNATGNILTGENPLQVSALPLAAGIREGRQRYISQARPLPADIKESLKGYFPESVLNRAKYCVADGEIALPNILESFFGQDGVTVDDIIVFRSTPSRYVDWLWIHELTHVQQYTWMGIEKFSYNYMTSHSALEKEADDKAYAFFRQ